VFTLILTKPSQGIGMNRFSLAGMPECIRPYKLWDAGMCTNGYMEDTPTPTSPNPLVSRVKWISVEMDQVTAPNL
jgi:hypothetical protein